MIVDSIAGDNNLFWRYNPDWIAYYAKSTDFILLKPATYMNKSGVAVAHAANFFKIDKKDILVVYDEVDLPFGKIRLSFDSLSAGHKGVDSIIQSLSGVEFSRLRFGISPTSPSTTLNELRGSRGFRGVNKPKDAEKYVLKDFTKEEAKKLEDLVKVVKEAIKSYLANGIDATMNRFN